MKTALLTLLLLGFACAPPDDAPPEETPWSLEETLRIGSAASGGMDELAYVPDVWSDPMGRIWVADGPSREIRVFAPDGTPVRTVGRQGSGPGELGVITALEEGPQGRLWVADGGNGRWAVFDTAGAPVATHPYAPGMFRYGDRWGTDGLLYTHIMTSSGFSPDMALVARRLVGGELLPSDTLFVPRIELGRTVPVSFVRDGRRMTTMIPLPFQPLRKRLLLPGSGWWFSDPGERYRLARVDLQGDTVQLLEEAWQPVPVTPEQAAEALGDFPEAADVDPGMLPDHHPPVDDLMALPDGHLFVRRTSADGHVWDVWSPAGERVATLPVPGGPRFEAHHATDDALYGVMRGELDVPYVVRLSIRRGA